MGQNTKIITITENMLEDVRADIKKHPTVTMPIAEMAALGAGISSLIPAVRTIAEKTPINTEVLYRLANEGVGDVLKISKNGNFWGAFKTADGGSKLAQLQAVVTTDGAKVIASSINPAIIMMAVALYKIDKQLGEISELQHKILSFLEREKESEIEADVETVLSIVRKYKFNWNNDNFLKNNHKLVLDIQRTSRKHINSYNKSILEILNSKHHLVTKKKVEIFFDEMLKKFEYYRLSVYTYSMASLVEIMLNGNFSEEYIGGIKSEIEKLSINYREIYGTVSTYLEKMRHTSVESIMIKGVGNTGKAVGKMIGSIPVVKEGKADELLQEGGQRIKDNEDLSEKKLLASFAKISNPETTVFTENMGEMIRIYNHTSDIYFDNKNVYLLTE